MIELACHEVIGYGSHVVEAACLQVRGLLGYGSRVVEVACLEIRGSGLDVVEAACGYAV